MDKMFMSGVWMLPLSTSSVRANSEPSVVVCVRNSSTAVELSWIDCNKREIIHRSKLESVPERTNVSPLWRVGDIDGDGVEDVALLSRDRATAYSAVTGKQLSEVLIPDVQGVQAPTAACECGDLDDDGIPDLLIGRPSLDVMSGDGIVSAFSSKTGKFLMQSAEPARGPGFGTSLLVRKSGSSMQVYVGKFGLFDGGIDILSGQSLLRSASIPGLNGELPDVAMRLFPGDDYDGDGVTDLVASRYSVMTAGISTQGAVVYSGKDHSMIVRIERDQVLVSLR